MSIFSQTNDIVDAIERNYPDSPEEPTSAQKNKPQPDERPINFNVTGVDDLIDDMNEQSGQVNDDQFTVEDYPEDKVTDELDNIPSSEQKHADDTASFVVSTADDLISKAFGLYAKTDPEKLKAKKSDLNEIAHHFAPYFAVSKFKMEPWVMGAILAAFVMFDKFKSANELRKVNIKLESEQQRTADLEARIKDLELEKREQELKKKVENLEKETAE